MVFSGAREYLCSIKDLMHNPLVVEYTSEGFNIFLKSVMKMTTACSSFCLFCFAYFFYVCDCLLVLFYFVFIFVIFLCVSYQFRNRLVYLRYLRL